MFDISTLRASRRSWLESPSAGTSQLAESGVDSIHFLDGRLALTNSPWLRRGARVTTAGINWRMESAHLCREGPSSWCMERKVQRASETYVQTLGKKLQLVCYSSLHPISDLGATRAFRTSACRSSSVLAAKATRLAWLNDAPTFAPY